MTGLCAIVCLAALPWTAALQRALDSSAEWTMERRLTESGRTLVSAGQVDCIAQSGIVWRVTSPLPTTIAMTRDAMTFSDEEGVRRRELSELPHYAEIRERADAFAAGDTHAFDGMFEVAAESYPVGGWKLVLTPRISEMRRLFTVIELTGGQLPTNAVMRFENGGASVIRFRGVSRGR